MSRINQIRFLSFFILLLQCTKPSLSQANCSGAVCKPLENCILEVLEDGSCCPSCAQFGCPCEGYQYYDCLSVGFQGGKVPEGESYFVDFGSTECTCPSGGGRISCHFIPCPELPPNCIDIMQPADGCVQCGRIGCIHGEEKYEAGHTFHMSHCKFCHCPNTGGELMCYAVPDCDMEVDNTTHLRDTTENDPERQYDYPYSHEQDPMEIVEKNNNYKRNALQDHSMLDYEDVIDEEVTTFQTTMQPINLVEHTTTHYSTYPTTQPSTMIYTTEHSTSMPPITSTESRINAKTTTPPDVVEQTTSQPPTTQYRRTTENTAKGKTLELDLQINKTQDSDPAVNKDNFPEEEKEGNIFSTAATATATSVLWSPSPSAEPQVIFPRLGEGEAPKDILNQSRPHDGKMPFTCGEVTTFRIKLHGKSCHFNKPCIRHMCNLGLSSHFRMTTPNTGEAEEAQAAYALNIPLPKTSVSPPGKPAAPWKLTLNTMCATCEAIEGPFWQGRPNKGLHPWDPKISEW